jgi:hypothetical protein
MLEERRRRFSEVLPGLKRMETEGKLEQKNATVYEGIKGLKSAYNDIYMTMKPGEEYYFFQVAADSLKSRRIFLFFRNWHRRRSGKGVNIRGLAIEAAREPMKGIFRGLPHSKLRYVDEFLPTGMVVYKNKTLLIDFQDQPAAFLIQSQAIADSFRQFFEVKWKTAKN